MESLYRIEPASRVEGVVRPPSSKSLSQRYFQLALLTRQPVTIERPLVAEDTRDFLRALKKLGVEVDQQGSSIDLRPGPPPEFAELHCGDSGTMLRFISAALTTIPGEWVVDGSEHLRVRPVGPMIRALRTLGARIKCLRQEGYAPLRIEGGSLEGGEARVDAGESSQYLSALLMAALCARGETTLTIESLMSKPYVDLTLDAIEQFGGQVEGSTSGTLRVIPEDLHGGNLIVEGDWSAAAYPAAAATLVGGRVELEGLDLNSRQGDRRFLDVLVRMGAVVQLENGRVVVEGSGQVFGVEVDMSDIPDQVPTLAALAPFAKGITRISNVPHLRLKESDRLHAMTAELRRAGATVEELVDGLVIPGKWAEAEPPSNPVRVESHRDHRIAMSMAIAGLRRSGLAMLDANVVSKSYPDFWEDLGTLVRA